MSPSNPGDRRESQPLRPSTKVLTHGFDPTLSVGSARPAVFRSSTYVFPTPEAAERAFNISSGRAQISEGEGTDLIYSRFNHPNAQILQDQIVHLEADATAALAFNSGMSAIMTSLLTFLHPGQSVVYTIPIYGGTQHFIQDYLEKWGVTGIPVFGWRADLIAGAIASAPDLGAVLLETPANPTLIMTDIRASLRRRRRFEDRKRRVAPAGDGGQHAARPHIPASAVSRSRSRRLFRNEISFRLERHARRNRAGEGREINQENRSDARPLRHDSSAG